jgi:hypothetical protein
MPKLVSELAQGNAFSRSADGGQLADTATRVFKIILDSPNESVDIMSAVGVQIGDPYSSGNPIPCVSVEGRADGESRLVRIVTCQYRTSGMVDGEGGTGLPDPMLVMPDVRPANFSTSTSLYEMAAYKWWNGNRWEEAVNAVGDILDGMTTLQPITTIRITQFEPVPGTIYARHCGKINSEPMNLGSFLSCGKHTVMFKGVEAAPHVETFGITVYRGFMNSYEFMYRPHFVDGYGEVGWDILIPHTGFNCKAFNPSAPRNPGNPAGGQDPYALPLKRDGEFGAFLQPLELQERDASGRNARIQIGEKVRAMVKVSGYEKNISQLPSAQPVALNEDGTPRSDQEDKKVVLWQRGTQDRADLSRLIPLRVG